MYSVLQALTVIAVDVGPHMHMDLELVAEALRTYFLSKVAFLQTAVSWTSDFHTSNAKEGLCAQVVNRARDECALLYFGASGRLTS